MGGKKKEPEIIQAPTKTEEQSQLLTSLLSMMGDYMGPGAFGSMPTLGERYGGGRTGRASDAPTGTPSPGGGGKGGTTPGGMGPGGQRPGGQMRKARGSPLDELLTGPIVNSYREGMTGNYPRRGGR